MAAKLTLHHLNNSRSQRILWLLEELGLEYELKSYQRDAKSMLAPDDLKKIHPLGKAPILEDGDKVLAESGAIIEYVLAHYDTAQLGPNAQGVDPDRYRYWLHYAEASAMPPLLLKLVFTTIRTQAMPFFAKPIAIKIAEETEKRFIHPQLRLHFDFIESELKKSEWFAGESFSAADIQMSFPAEGAEAAGLLKKGYPRLNAFLQKIRGREGYKQAVEKGGNFQLLAR